eukprot:9232465-Pyramimonas_sp.AAC.1
MRDQVHEPVEALVQAVGCRGVVDPGPSCEAHHVGGRGTRAAPALVALGTGRARARLRSVC